MANSRTSGHYTSEDYIARLILYRALSREMLNAGLESLREIRPPRAPILRSRAALLEAIQEAICELRRLRLDIDYWRIAAVLLAIECGHDPDPYFGNAPVLAYDDEERFEALRDRYLVNSEEVASLKSELADLKSRLEQAEFQAADSEDRHIRDDEGCQQT